MSYRDIAVYLDAGDDCESRLATAVDLASRHGARLIGLDISTNQAFAGPLRDRALGLEDAFNTKVKSAGLKGLYCAADMQDASSRMLRTHCADLLVATQPHPDQHHLADPSVPKDVLTSAGVPMLLLPNGWTGPGPLGRTVVMAWNFSREATRAVHDAMPILTAAEKVYVYVFAAGYDPRNEDLHDVISHLEQHGVRAHLDGWRDMGDRDVDPTSALFSLLDREGADLIVAGAYGHAPVFEDVFGGVSRTLLNNACMPVLMSH